MQQRRFGSTALTVSQVGFGCARIGGVFEDSTKSGLLKVLRSAFDHGITFFDTADMYTQGESERLLGQAFARDRDKIVIASKAGFALPAQKRAIARIKPLLRPVVQRLGIKRENIPSGLKGTITQNFSAEYLIASVEGSLKQLRTDYLDLFQLHSPPRSVLEEGGFLEPLEKLQREGKIRYYGVSCETTEDAALCLRYPGLSSLQVRLSLLEQSALTEVLPRAAEQGTAIIARECFAGGMLAKSRAALAPEAITPDRPGQRGIDSYYGLADDLGRPLRELAAQFVLSIDQVSVALFGIRTQQHLEENLRYVALGRLGAEELATLTETPKLRQYSGSTG